MKNKLNLLRTKDPIKIAQHLNSQKSIGKKLRLKKHYSRNAIQKITRQLVAKCYIKKTVGGLKQKLKHR